MVQGEEITSDSPSTVPNALMIDQNPHPERHQTEEISNPSIAPDTPSIPPNLQQSISKNDEAFSDRPSAAKQLIRTGACGFVITVIVGSAFIWQSSDDTTTEMAKSWINSLVRSSSLLPTKLPHEHDVASLPVSTTSDQLPAEAAVIPPTASADKLASKSIASESFPDLQQQFKTIASDLAIVRRLVEQVSARQDQMAQDIETLQAAEQDLSQKISAAPSVFDYPHPAAQKK